MKKIARYVIGIILAIVIFRCSDALKTDKNIIGLREEIIINKFGKPKSEHILGLAKNSNLMEYQSNLYKIYPNIKLNDTIKIKEMRWKNSNLNKVVWFENKENDWIVVDNLMWDKNIRF